MLLRLQVGRVRLNPIAKAPMDEWLSGNMYEPELARLDRLLATSSARVGDLLVSNLMFWI